MPLITTTGGGSITGFGRGPKEVAPPRLLFATADDSDIQGGEIDVTNYSVFRSFADSGYIQQSFFPAVNQDVWESPSGSLYMIYGVNSSQFAKVNIDDFSDRSIISHNIQTTCRAYCVGRDGLLYIGAGNNVVVFNLETNTISASLSGVVPGGNCQSMFTTSTHLFIEGNLGVRSLTLSDYSTVATVTLTDMQMMARIDTNRLMIGGDTKIHIIDFQNDGTFSAPITGDSVRDRVESIILGHNGFVYIGSTNSAGPSISRFTKEGAGVNSTTAPSGQLAVFPNSLSYFDGKLWVGGWEGTRGRIHVYDPSLALIATVNYDEPEGRMSGYGLNTARPRWQEFDAAMEGGP